MQAVLKESASDLELLSRLNSEYIRAVDQKDVAWFERHLSADFLNTNPDGSLVDRAAFLRQIGRGAGVSGIKESDVRIRILGDTAIHFVLADRIATEGTSLAGLDPSSYRSALEAYFGSGYPLGSHAALAAVRPLASRRLRGREARRHSVKGSPRRAWDAAGFGVAGRCHAATLASRSSR